MPETTSALERLLRRDRVIAIAGVAVLSVLAWLYILGGAGLGMPAMSAFELFPHQRAAADMSSMPDMPGMDMTGMDMSGMDMSASAPAAPWSLSLWTLMIAMWWVMMIAMMSPAAAPAVLLYARVHRHAAQGSALAPTGPFALGYLSVWMAFSVIATALTWLLAQTDMFAAATMGSQSRWLSGGVLIAAGLYQFSPLKDLCLSHCRSPAEFLTRHWRPGAAGAFRLGVLHGAYCVGCCWLLMALLFVGGVMNLIWIALLAILVLLEKNAPYGRWIARAGGLVFLTWGVATLLV